MPRVRYLRRHPRSGVFEFFRSVPPELRPLIGKTLIRKSLGGRDWTAAVEQAFYKICGRVASRPKQARCALVARPEDDPWRLGRDFVEAAFPQGLVKLQAEEEYQTTIRGYDPRTPPAENVIERVTDTNNLRDRLATYLDERGVSSLLRIGEQATIEEIVLARRSPRAE